MGYHFRIIGNMISGNINSGNIHSTSENMTVSDGFGGKEDFRGYNSESQARFWARDSMKLHSLKVDEWRIETYEKYYKPISTEHVNVRGKYNKHKPDEDDDLETIDNISNDLLG